MIVDKESNNIATTIIGITNIIAIIVPIGVMITIATYIVASIVTIGVTIIICLVLYVLL